MCSMHTAGRERPKDLAALDGIHTDKHRERADYLLETFSVRLHQAVDVVSKGAEAELHSLRSCQGLQAPFRAPTFSPFDLAPVS